MKICEIFYSIEGEGKRVGQPAIFIRRSGCNLHCLYDGKDCDTPYRDEGIEMSVQQIMNRIAVWDCKNVTLTGGEPLLSHPELDDLRMALYRGGYKVNIETNGTMSTQKRYENEFFTVDYKCGCSGMSDKMEMSAFRYLTARDCIKFVVSENDFQQVEDVFIQLRKKCLKENSSWRPMVYISPCFGRCDLQKLAEFVKEFYSIYKNVAMNLQVHKIIYDPNDRGV